MKLLKSNLLGILLTAAAFAVVAALYPAMPERVPTHWNIHGVADGFMPKPWGPFVLPLLMAGVLAIFIIIRRASPKEAPVERFGRVYSIFSGSVLAFLFVITVVAALAATGVALNMTTIVMIAVGALFVVMGNFMGKVTRNYFVGIRTPWTLANEEVWLRTHRLGGKVFVVGGLAVILSVLAGLPALAVAALFAVTLIPIVYSYIVYRRVTG
jgi:uncharacterized membrane protein